MRKMTGSFIRVAARLNLAINGEGATEFEAHDVPRLVARSYLRVEVVAGQGDFASCNWINAATASSVALNAVSPL